MPAIKEIIAKADMIKTKNMGGLDSGREESIHIIAIIDLNVKI
jgi:hypothetical protein